MFKNTLTGLTKKEKEVFDEVCRHLNGCLQRMNIKYLDGEEDQILLDLWMDTFPYKTDENGNCVYKTVRNKVMVTEPIYEKQLKMVKDESGNYVEKLVDVVVGGKNVEKIVEKQVREIDYSKSLIESTSVGIYKWRGEQLLINKCIYLFGDQRVQRMVDGKPVKETVVDKWGNTRQWNVYDIDPNKVGKRCLALTMNESDLSNDDGDPCTIDDVAGGVEDDLDTAMLLYDISRVCDDVEMKVVKKFMAGDSANRIYEDFEKAGISFSARRMAKLKEKVAQVLRPELSKPAEMLL